MEHDIRWWHEEDGEIVTLERWEGDFCHVLGLDADFTLGEALEAINDYLGDELEELYEC